MISEGLPMFISLRLVLLFEKYMQVNLQAGHHAIYCVCVCVCVTVKFSLHTWSVVRMWSQ